MSAKQGSGVEEFVKKLGLWNDEVKALRAILLKTKMSETLKWRYPCYCIDDANIVIIQPFKKYLGLMFFKGALLKDSKGILVANGPNSHSSKRLEFTSLAQIIKMEPTIKSYVAEAIKAEKAGLKITKKKTPIVLPTELVQMFKADSKLKVAFNALTPGRQRAYILFFSSAKQSETRISRIKKNVPRILSGQGMND